MTPAAVAGNFVPEETVDTGAEDDGDGDISADCEKDSPVPEDDDATLGLAPARELAADVDAAET